MKDFVRIGVTDRCISYKGKTYNYRTGHKWDFFYNFNTEKDLNIQYSEPLPFSNLNIALLK